MTQSVIADKEIFSVIAKVVYDKMKNASCLNKRE
jgi:hypothetical protein